jgi:hypothetical protein
MRKLQPGEWLLACFAGRVRAAAIMGDLTEMAGTRGRLWFAADYVSTLLSLTWRIVLALFVADVAREFIFNLAHLYFRVAPQAWRSADASRLLPSMGPLLACILSTLWFVLPFAAVRYGLRDRFVRLTLILALGTTVAFLAIPWVSVCFAIATLGIAIGAWCSKSWRAPVEVLAGTTAAGLGTFLAAASVRSLLHFHGGVGRFLINNTGMLGFQASLLAIAIVGSRLHRRLLERPAAQDRPLA